jgi:hypothetical protein
MSSILQTQPNEVMSTDGRLRNQQSGEMEEVKFDGGISILQIRRSIGSDSAFQKSLHSMNANQKRHRNS